MYAAGADHPNKAPSVDFLREVAEGKVKATVDAEVLQEILHRYRALNRWSDGKFAYDMARRIFLSVIPITAAIVDRARIMLDDYDALVARDALHAAVLVTHEFDAICSYDQNFDGVPTVRRIEPKRFGQ